MNAYPAPSGLSAPGAGFASRGKSHRPNRLSLASTPKIGSISENPSDGLPNPPRTSRSHLLAGLRTQPRTPGPVPASAPYNKTSHGQTGYGMTSQQYQQPNVGYGNVPHTAIGANFPSMSQQHSQQRQQMSLNPGQQLYGLPEQVLAPPPLEIDDGDDHIDPQLAAQLYATQMYLQERQMQLQQLAMQQQMQNLKFGGHNNKSSYPQTPVTPQQYMYAQAHQAAQQQALDDAIVFQQVPGQPGVLIALNRLTGEASLIANPLFQQQGEMSNSPPPPTPSRANGGRFSNDNTPSTESENPFGSRSRSPPKRTSPPAANVEPLPPPSANAFRRGHNRNRSSLALANTNGAIVADGPRSAMIRPVGIPATPMTGTFAPGHGRAGEHPSRQPVGPPAIDELKKAPTSKFEGSKNFATRQRRKALSTLVRAGLERRVARPGSGAGSVGSTTPVSENELTFSVPSDNDSDSGRSLSGRLSIGSLRAAASGAIGSERIQLRSRSKESLNSCDLQAEQKEASTPVLAGLGASA
jgi:hypothetical protein